MRLVLALSAMLNAAGPANAQGPTNQPTLEQALAVAVAGSMPDIRYDWQLNWSAFGSYSSRDIRWHLAPPNPYYGRDPPAPGITRRTGWISINGRSASVAVCGDDDRVGAMMLETSDIWLGDGDLTSELAQAGVTTTLLEQRDRPPIFDEERGEDLPDYYTDVITAYPAYRLMRLERTGHEPVLLTSVYVCTGPGTRSATSCDMQWTVHYRTGPVVRSDPCLAPAEPYPVRLD